MFCAACIWEKSAGNKTRQETGVVPGVHIIRGKSSVASVEVAGGLVDTLSNSVEVLGKSLGSKEHLDWLKKDFSRAKIITVQGYKCTKN